MAKKKKAASAPAPAPARDPADKGYRVAVDLVEGDPDFILRFDTPSAALAQVDKIFARGYAIHDHRDNKLDRYDVVVYPLHRIRKLSLYKG